MPDMMYIASTAAAASRPNMRSDWDKHSATNAFLCGEEEDRK
jgi:hypothetical protein